LRVPGGSVGRVVDDEVGLLAVGGADGGGEEGELDPGFVQVSGDEEQQEPALVIMRGVAVAGTEDSSSWWSMQAVMVEGSE